MWQGANSALRCTTYTTLAQMTQDFAPCQTLPSSVIFCIGAIAGIVSVYATMPLFVTKTRMHSPRG
ncbi:hypothetical protein PENSPDRAFT_653049 [Peniophora sp. CONT]|nr:hypothetical protein PENSPDRAFT_653049 [Peniophora sp. CONT]